MERFAPLKTNNILIQLFVGWFFLVILHSSLSGFLHEGGINFVAPVPELPPEFGFQLWDSAFYAAIFVWPLVFLERLSGKKKKKKKSRLKAVAE